MNPSLSDLIRLSRELDTAAARGKINAKTRMIDEKARKMRAGYTSSQINQRRRMMNGIRTKHK